MIILKELRWDNAFSYGAGNVVSFTDSQLTQLIGKNGHGKSSIALILEELLFNKNSKGIKKGDILNRHVKDKTYKIELDFSKDNDEYSVKTTRGSTQTIKLFKNGDDISAHTATNTYKMLEDIIGMDHKTFCQIVYQSNASSLEFLTATDSNRKKFLIELLNLEKYTKASEIFKSIATDVSKQITKAESKVDTIRSWLVKFEKTDTSETPYCEVPELDSNLLRESAEIEAKISALDSENAKITKNNTYKALQAKINLLPMPSIGLQDTSTITSSIAVSKKTKADAKAFIDKMKALHGTCPTCLQDINDTKVKSLIDEYSEIFNKAEEELTVFNSKLADINNANEEFNRACKAQAEWEKYHTLIDTNMQEELLDKESLETRLNELATLIKETNTLIANAQQHNKLASAHNAKVEGILSQLEEYKSDLMESEKVLEELNSHISIINVLVKTFSTTGLVAYKIECLVKDLEELTNTYLADMSGGRFQIMFQVSASDKLNVVISDNGKDIDILALSGGERARVNISALLAIRKLMQSLSSSRINLLILDETVEALDIDGKDKLVEVLLKEESLNTFLISHGFSHPLLEKVNIVKEHNISRIEK